MRSDMQIIVAKGTIREFYGDEDSLAEASKFSKEDFEHPIKEISKLKDCTFNSMTGIYKKPGSKRGDKKPAGRASAKVFWDPRVGGFRLKKDHIEYIDDSFKYIGKKYEDVYPLVYWSVTLTRSNLDVPKAWLDLLLTFMQTHCEKGAASLERGAKADNLHVQAMLGIHSASGDKARLELQKALKCALGVMANDGSKVMPKRIGKSYGNDGPKFILGYIFKDNGKSHFRNVRHNISAEEQKRAYEHWLARHASPMSDRRILKKANLLAEAFKFYNEKLRPIPIPHIVRMVMYMIQSGGYMPDGSFADGRTMDLRSTQILWENLHFHKNIKPQHVAAVIFGAPDPGDSLYKDRHWDEIKRIAMEERQRARDDEDDELDIGELPSKMKEGAEPLLRDEIDLRDYEKSSTDYPPEPDYMALPDLSNHEMYLLPQENGRTQLNRPGVGAEIAAQPRVERLSAWTRTWLNKKKIDQEIGGGSDDGLGEIGAFLDRAGEPRQAKKTASGDRKTPDLAVLLKDLKVAGHATAGTAGNYDFLDDDDDDSEDD